MKRPQFVRKQRSTDSPQLPRFQAAFAHMHGAGRSFNKGLIRTHPSCCIQDKTFILLKHGAAHNSVNVVVAPGAVPPEQQRRTVLQTSILVIRLAISLRSRVQKCTLNWHLPVKLRHCRWGCFEPQMAP